MKDQLASADTGHQARFLRIAWPSCGGEPGLFVCAIQGNFHHLARYTQLHYSPARSHRRRIYTLLGGTLGNLENEPEFFRHSLVTAAPGDLLLLGFTLTVPEPKDTDDIWKRDPALRKSITALHERWLRGPLQRDGVDSTYAKLSNVLDVSRPVPGSYGLNSMADVRILGGQTHRSAKAA